MTLFEACMAGVEITMPDGTLHQVDFVVKNEHRVVAFLAYWWEVDWTQGQNADGVLVFDYPLVDKSKESISLWEIDSPYGVARVSPYLADGASEKVLADIREWMDVSRGEYLLALSRLRTAYPDFDFTAWVALVLDRPEIDAVEALKKVNLGKRKTGSIRLLGADNEVVDGLIVDENGNAAVAAGNAWLATLAEAWQTREERPDIEDYIKWIKLERPYGPYSLGDPTVSFREGHIEELAISLLG